MKDHYLAGACEGISLHTRGRELSIRDKFGREKEKVYYCDDESHASESLYRWRDILYKRYEETR